MTTAQILTDIIKVAETVQSLTGVGGLPAAAALHVLEVGVAGISAIAAGKVDAATVLAHVNDTATALDATRAQIVAAAKLKFAAAG